MTKIFYLTLIPTFLGLISCGSIDERTNAQLASEINTNTPKAEQLYQKGKLAEEKGDIKEAAEKYDELAIRFPSYDGAAELNHKAASYWEKLSKPEQAFASYQNYIQTFRNGRNYSSALERQSNIAFTAAKGGLTKRFLGMKSEPDYDKVVEFLDKVRDNAPASDLATRAQFAIGTYSEGKEKSSEAVEAFFKVVDAYPNHSLAPEATFRAGKVLSGYTEKGNQNSSNLNRARRTLEDLIQQYPDSAQASQARTLLSEISSTDVKRTLDIAEFYEKKGKVESAKYYYQEVMNKAPAGSELHNDAQDRLNSL